MKKTSKDFMEWLGLQVGDKVKIKFEVSNIIDETITTEELIVNIVSDNNWGVGLENDGVVVPIERLLNKDFNILPKPKRIGDLKCGKISENKECSKCPLRSICATLSTGRKTTLYEMLEIYKLDKGSYLDQEIYDLLKARLDKEVKENDDKM